MRFLHWLRALFSRAKRVRVATLPAFLSATLGNTRTLSIFLPDDYDTAPDKHYPVLYAHDGQDMGAVKLKKTLETLYAANAIQRVLVVAIHATRDRMQEYGTADIPNAQGFGKLAGLYSRFVLEEVKPYVDAHYRTLTGPAATATMGWSLGGLMAFDLAWHHPEVFGAAGAFSGSFWWREAQMDSAAEQASRIAHKNVRAGEHQPGLRFWFQAGTLDETADRDHNGVIDAIQDTTELMDELRALGYADNVEMVYVQVEGGRHNPATWAKVLPDFLKWVFPPRP